MVNKKTAISIEQPLFDAPLVEKRSRGRLFAKGGDERRRLDTARF
jgi:hypothetical protein